MKRIISPFIGAQGEIKGIVAIKIGSSSLLSAHLCCLNLRALACLVECVRRLKDSGHPVIIVSSGAVAAGCQKLGLKTRPDDVAERQALAAIGQVQLMRYYEDMFSAVGIVCSQVLLTLENLAVREQYLNASATFSRLLRHGVVPIVNENDTVAVEQLRIGDNDTLAAQVATLVQAEWLFLLTDVDALYTANPSIDPTATPIRQVSDITEVLSTVKTNSSEENQWGVGGMATKLTAANIATAAGTKMVICNADPDLVTRIILENEENIGTLFLPSADPVVEKYKRWILSAPPKGHISLNSDAVEALLDGNSPRHITIDDVSHVEGEFHSGDAVVLREASSGVHVGKAVAELSFDEFTSKDEDDYDRTNECPITFVDPTNICLLPSIGASTTASAAASVDHDGSVEEDSTSRMASSSSTPRISNNTNAKNAKTIFTNSEMYNSIRDAVESKLFI